MKVERLFLRAKQHAPPQAIGRALLVSGGGMALDWRAEGDQALSLWDFDAQKRAEHGSKGLCRQRFFANIIISGLADACLHTGDALAIGGAVVQITQIGKRCFPECALSAEEALACPLLSCAFAKVEQGGAVSAGDAVSRIPAPRFEAY